MWIMMTMQARASRPQNNAANNPIYVTSQDKQRLKDLLMEAEVSDRAPMAISKLSRKSCTAQRSSRQRIAPNASDGIVISAVT
jgi:hypothetical protein